MIKQHFKQAWNMMRQNKLFSSIYITGTGLSIAFTMVLFIIYYVKFAPVYPEYNRNRTLVIDMMNITQKDNPGNYSCNHGLSYKIVDMLKDLPHLDKIGASSMMGDYLGYALTMPESNEVYMPIVNLTDRGFWEVFTFDFIDGKPYEQADVEAGLPKAVISESLAKRIFTRSDVAGEYIDLDGKDVQVCGVVKDASTATPITVGEIYLPLYFLDKLRPSSFDYGLSGSVQLYLTAPSEDDIESLRSEVQEVFKQHNLQDTELDNNLMNQPDIWWKNYFRTECNHEPDIAKAVRGILYMLLALLFIPAMNLCGMISSRMDERLSEMGLRKAYGATNRSLIGQILTENLLLTVIGGLLGLALAYIITIAGGETILNLMDENVTLFKTISTKINLEMLINLPLFLTVFSVCVLLNLISALVPTLLALRHPIIHSIQTKR
ncbi:MAG: ABC transporter permease [Bacteroidaceae bacterium]|nr:ABC transporter permease [Bacteroidaceae bacterium]